MHGKIKNLESLTVFRCYLRSFGSDPTGLIKFLGKTGKDLSRRLLRFLKVVLICWAFCDKINPSDN